MARATTRTKLPLDTWAQLMGVHPLHFNQITIAALQDSPLCDRAWLQHEWQGVDRTGREAVANAIALAESKLEAYLGYSLVPTWEVDEWRPMSRASRPEWVNLSGTDVRGMRTAVVANRGYFIMPGIEAKTLIEADSGITYDNATDQFEDAVPYQETASITVTIEEGTPPCELAVFYPDKGGDARWEIRPVSVELTNETTAVITFPRAFAVVEAALEELDPDDVEGTDDALFLETADVYRHYNDPRTQAILMWEGGACGCLTSECSACSFSVQTACLHSRDDPRHSMLVWQPAEWNADDLVFDGRGLGIGRQPDIIRLNYLAGWRDRAATCAATMDGDIARTVAIFAAALLDRPPCGCAALEERINRWRRDLAFVRGAEELAAYNLAPGDLENPFGTQAGAVYAWHWANRRTVGPPIAEAMIHA